MKYQVFLLFLVFQYVMTRVLNKKKTISADKNEISQNNYGVFTKSPTITNGTIGYQQNISDFYSLSFRETRRKNSKTIKRGNDNKEEKVETTDIQLYFDENQQIINKILKDTPNHMTYLEYYSYIGFDCPQSICEAIFKDFIQKLYDNEIINDNSNSIMPGATFLCKKEDDTCNVIIFDKIKKFPIDSEQGLLILFEFFEEGKIDNYNIYIYVVKNPCMVCCLWYHLFVKKYPLGNIYIFYSIFDVSIDKTSQINHKFDLSISKIYKKQAGKWILEYQSIMNNFNTVFSNIHMEKLDIH